MKTELIFIRHGETDSNIRGVLHGRTDVPLTPVGREQAARVARRIAGMGPFDSIYSSPLQRALATATEIGSRIGVHPTTDPRLSEFDFGDLEGLTFEDLQSHHPELYLSMIDPSGYHLRFPNGESRSSLHERVISSLDLILQRQQSSRTIIVAHLVVIGTAVAHLTTGDPDDVVRYLVRNCSLTHLELNGSSPAVVLSLDDASHLE